MRKNKDDILPNVVAFDDESQPVVNKHTRSKTSPPRESASVDAQKKQSTEEIDVQKNDAVPEEVLEEVSEENTEVFTDNFTQAPSDDGNAFSNFSPDENFNQPTSPVDAPSVGSIRFERLTKIFSKMAFFLTIVTVLLQLGTFVSYAVWAIIFLAVFIVALCVTIFTLGTKNEVWLSLEEISNSTDKIDIIASALYNFSGVICPIGLVITTLAIIFNFTCKRRKSKVRIVSLFISIAILTICYAVLLALRGAQW